MLHVPFYRLDEIRDKIVASRELHVNLCESVPYAIAFIDETVVNSNRPEHYRGDYYQEYQE